MNPRAIKDLAQFSDDRLKSTISEGLRLLHDNLSRLSSSAYKLTTDTDEQARRILLSLAEEEAGKYLILVDAIRCPRVPSQFLGEHLRKFYDHLARGIYCKACAWRPAGFAEVIRSVKLEREAFYLDGPNDVDFIYRNQILSEREETMYVDFSLIESEHQWVAPIRKGIGSFGALTSSGIRRVDALHRTGIWQARSLEIVAKIWREFQFQPTTHYQEFRKQNLKTLEMIEAAGLLEPCKSEIYAEVIDEWPLPMWGLN